MIRSKSVLALVFVLSLTAAACGSDSEEPSGSTGTDGVPTVKIDALNTGLSGVALKAIEVNDFDDANGFEGEFIYLDPDVSSQYVLQSKSDVTFGFDVLGVAIARTEGHDLTAFFPTTNNNGCILVRGDSPYESPEDLIGEKVGHFGVDSGTTVNIAMMVQEFYGFDLYKEYELVESDPATLVELLGRGEVEAIFDFIPHQTRAIVEADAKCIFGPVFQEWEEREGGPVFISMLSASEAWLQDNTELATSVRDAWIDAYAWLQENPEQLKEEPFASLLGQENPDVLDLMAEQVAELPFYVGEFTDEDRAALEAFIDLTAEQGILFEEHPGGVVQPLEEIGS